MKKILIITLLLSVTLFGALPLASAVTIYTENWGGNNATVVGNGTLGPLGWTGVADSQTAQPFLGIFQQSNPNASSVNLGIGLPTNIVFFTGLTLPAGIANRGQTNGAGMFYTTNGAASAIDSTFTSINPSSFPNLTFNVEVRVGGGNLANYFAVAVGGAWYVATNNPLTQFTGSYPTFTNWSMVYDPTASVWNNLTIDPSGTFVTIGSQAGVDLSGPITGIGIVELNNTNFAGSNNGLNYSQIVINQGPNDFPHVPATIASSGVTPINVISGGGATFSPSSSGTPNLFFHWQTNGVNIANGANVASATGTHYLGAQTGLLTITNVSANDAILGITNFSVVVTNFFGSATSSVVTLNILPRSAGLLYAELFPVVGSTGNSGLPDVGWVTATSGGSTFGIFQGGANSGTDGGTVFEFSPAAATNAFYTTATNDTGLSGLPFPVINPANVPAVTFQAAFSLGGAGTLSEISAYWVVQMSDPVGGTNWYSSASPINIISGTYPTNQFAFSTAATNWNNLTISNNVVTLGSQASSPLAGNITGAGLVFVHTASADMNFANFEILTNALTVVPPVIGANYPIDVSVPSGGGASFGVATVSGSQPFGYFWKTNGVLVSNGGRVSGANTATLTIANLNANDSGMQIVAFVTNSAGTDESDTTASPAPDNPTMLTVTNPPVGEIYLDQFPFVGPVTGNYPIESVGWSEAVSGTPFPVFRRGTAGNLDQGDGAVFAFFGSAATNVYFTSTATDTNQSGLPFPNINLASYTDLSISVDIAPNSASSTNVAAYLAVQLNGTNWYVAANPLLGLNTASNSTYSTFTMAFIPTATLWNNLMITSGTGGTIGSAAANDLKGVMTGVGLVFVTVGSGGTFNFDNLLITGTGVGGINVGSLTGGKLNLSWVGNPAVELQSTTSLNPANWQDIVPDTHGLYSLPVSATGPQKFFRLKTP